MLMPVAATAAIWVRDTNGDIELLVSLVVITMSLGTLIAPTYLYFMSGLTANSIVIPRLSDLAPSDVGVLLPLVVGVALNKILRKRLPRVQPYFAFMGNVGLFMAVFLNVGTASPLLRRLSLRAGRLRDAHRAGGQHGQLHCSARRRAPRRPPPRSPGDLRVLERHALERHRARGRPGVVPQHAAGDRAGGDLHHLPASLRRHRHVAAVCAPRRR